MSVEAKASMGVCEVIRQDSNHRRFINVNIEG